MKKPRHELEWLVVEMIRGLLRPCPANVVESLGRWLGGAVWAVWPRIRKRMRQNLDLAYGEALTPRQKRVMAQTVCRHLGSALLDMLWTIPHDAGALARRVEFDGLENLAGALEHGCGAIVLTAHFGYWELMGVAQAHAGFPMTVLARKLDNPKLERRLAQFRCCSGNTVLHKRNAVRELIRILRNQGIVGVLMDQNVTREEGVFVDFFGMPACTTPLVAALAIRTGAPIVPAFAYPLGAGRWRFKYQKHLKVVPREDRRQAVTVLTQQCTSCIERAIRQHPHLWFWMHRRWKTRPAVSTDKRLAPSLKTGCA